MNNHNYGRFLPDAIESALRQSHAHTEVVVVDDGSYDNSRDVISWYGNSVRAIFKENGGQGSAFNAGLEGSTGDVVLFLDADDVLLSTAASRAAQSLCNPEVVKVHWRSRVIDESGRATGALRPGGPLPEGDLREAAFRLGPTNHLSAPTSGNAWSRHFLDCIFPVPEVFTQGADTYLFELAPFFGPVKRVDEPQTLYRKHGRNFHSLMSLDYKIERQLRFYEACCAFLQGYWADIGIQVDRGSWVRHSWWHRLDLAVREIAALSAPPGPLIVVDDASWEVGPIAGRARIPFLERGGEYYGSPSDDNTAIYELERLRRSGAALVVFAWSALWWLGHYGEFHSHLRSHYACLLENDRIVVFELLSS
ncbi:MAG: glycosyltransferase [Actinomycetota bacterium]|nr:glycosyltransferase [Actinomycetota bacterium]